MLLYTLVFSQAILTFLPVSIIFTIFSHFQYMFFKKRSYYIDTTAREVKTMFSDKPSILACVTSQPDCDRIIREAKNIADACGRELRVLSILKPTTEYISVSDTIEYLYSVSKAAGADMTVLFNSDAPKAAAQFANANKVERIVTGMHDGGDKSFLVKFNELAPEVSITMVAKDNRIYTMELCKAYSD